MTDLARVADIENAYRRMHSEAVDWLCAEIRRLDAEVIDAYEMAIEDAVLIEETHFNIDSEKCMPRSLYGGSAPRRQVTGISKMIRALAPPQPASLPALPDLLELCAEAAHNEWMAEKSRRGVTTWPNERGFEQMVPYQDCPEDVKEFDRIVVGAIMRILKKRGLAAGSSSRTAGPETGERAKIVAMLREAADARFLDLHVYAIKVTAEVSAVLKALADKIER